MIPIYRPYTKQKFINDLVILKKQIYTQEKKPSDGDLRHSMLST